MFLPPNPYLCQEDFILVQNQGDILNQLIELHWTIYNKNSFWRKFLTFMQGKLKKSVISYFSNANKGFHLIKREYLPAVYLHVKLSLAIYAVSRQRP